MASLGIQARRALPHFSLAIGGSLLVLILIYIAHWMTDAPLGLFTRDPAQLTDESPLLGFLSQLGIFGWAASAAICLLAARVLVVDSAARRQAAFFAWLGVLTLGLGFDDVFMIHDVALPSLGLPELALLAFEALFLAAGLALFRNEILAQDVLLLVASLAFFAASVLFDIVETADQQLIFPEDGTKFTGICLWLAYFWQRAVNALDIRATTRRDFA